MPLTVTAPDGTSYHLYQLPPESSPEPVDTKELTTLDNDLSDGYRASALFGANTGLRSWKLKFPTLAGPSIPMPTVTDINGATVSREQYLRSLWEENKVTGTPFVYPDPASGQYYLVDFVDKTLSMERFQYVALYGTGLEVRQRRIVGKTVFDPTLMGVDTGQWDDDHGAVQWKQSAGTFNWGSFIPSGDVVFSANPQNGLNTVRFSGSASTGVATLATEGITSYSTAYDIFLVMKVREAAFSNAAGILSHTSSGQVLIGSSGTALFADLSHTNYEYRLDGVEYAQSAQAAPMNRFGLVHLRFKDGKYLNRWQIGKDRAAAGTFAKIDIADIVPTGALLPLNKVREMNESLTIKWGLS